MSATAPVALALWRHLFDPLSTVDTPTDRYVCVFSGKRQASSTALAGVQEKFYPWPISGTFAAGWGENEAKLGREAYFSPHLYTRQQRSKPTAAQVGALWFEIDGGALPEGALRPTALVESSPGHYHCYIRLTRTIAPEAAEELNRRLAYATGADMSGWDLTQLLRPPGTINHKRAEHFAVCLHYIEDRALDPDELDRLLPPAPPRLATPAVLGEALDWSGDEPPVRLGSDGLAWWTGTQAKRKADGSPNRSDTLFNIGLELAKANASACLIAGALADRDQALGFHKYSGRPDAAKQYATIAAKAIASPFARFGTPDQDRAIAELREELAEARRHITALHDLITAPGMTPIERVIAYGVANEHASALSRQAADDDGADVVISQVAIGAAVSVSRQSVGKALERWKAQGHLWKEPRPTGMLTKDGKPMSETVVRMPAKTVADSYAIASTWVRPKDAKHVGGNGNRCPECGSTERKRTERTVLVRTITEACADCGHIHHETTKEIGDSKTFIEYREGGDIPTMIDLATLRGGVSTVDTPCPESGRSRGAVLPPVNAATPPRAWGPVSCTDCYAEGRGPLGDIWTCLRCQRARSTGVPSSAETSAPAQIGD